MATIASLVYQPARSEQTPPYHYNRVPVEQVILLANHGIEGDYKAGRNPKRQLNIMSSETLLGLSAEGFKTGPGELGEQIVIRGLDVGTLKAGDRLQLGAEAVIEVHTHRTGCEWFELIQGQSRLDTAGRLGVMASVITGGRVAVGDEVRQIEAAQAAE